MFVVLVEGLSRCTCGTRGRTNHSASRDSRVTSSYLERRLRGDTLPSSTSDFHIEVRSRDDDAPMDVPVAANVLGTLGAVFWSIQLIPQIVVNYRRHNAIGLQPSMVSIHVSAGSVGYRG